MVSDGGGDGGVFDWLRVLELFVPAALSLFLAWGLFVAERSSQKKASKVGFITGLYERTYVQMHESMARTSQKLTEASSHYTKGERGKPFVASAGDDVRHALSLAMAIESPQKSALRDVLNDLMSFIEEVPDSKPVLEGEDEFFRLNALARKVKDVELEVLRFMTSGDMLRDAEAAAKRSQATSASDESSADDSDAKSSS